MRVNAVLAAACLACALSCTAGAIDKAVGKTIEWDKSTLVRVHSDVFCAYPRMIRARNGDILCSAESWGSSLISRSSDNGQTWSKPITAARSDHGGAANPELLLLRNGTILLFYNLRTGDGAHPFGIWVTQSSDDGKTWSGDRLLYAADTKAENGCWEPAAIQLPSGEIQLVFANESPYRNSSEQEITLLRSADNGGTWSKPKTISFRAGHRDGMPVPLVLSGGKGIVIAIEDDGLLGAFKPAIVHSSMNDNWNQPLADATSTRRWGALRNPLPAEDYAGAPYIRQMSTGETVLSFQHTDKSRTKPQMVVYVGDFNARNFDGRSVPFSVAPDASGAWNSLFVKDDRTVTAVSSCNGGIWAIDGHIVEAQRP